MIQPLFIDEQQDRHDIEKVNDLKKRFIYAAEEAQYIVDLFLSGVHIKSPSLNHDGVRGSFKSVVDRFMSYVYFKCNLYTPGNFTRSLNLDDVRRKLESVEVEFASMRINNMKILDSSRRTERTVLDQSASAQISVSRNSLGSKKLLDETIVGIDHDAELIRDKLVEDQKKVDVVSIVGMGGIGKTTLATKVFNDDYVKYHFHVRVWVTVSQTYDKRGVLIQIMESIRNQLDLEKASDLRLREMVHKNLMGQRYLIVIDDIWNIETWDNLKLFFPHNNNGSRILLTSRVTEVAKHSNSDGLIHYLECMNKERSWELLCLKVFNGSKCPEWSVKPGMQIVENCRGLPLAVVVIAGILAKEAWSEEFWVEIAERTGSYIVNDQNGCMETLALSYNHLPLRLRECFLYLGGFPEDYKIQVQMLLWLWVAEGFIQQDGNRSLEDIAEGYLMELIGRNLVIVSDRRNSNGAVKTCILHDLVRELCLRKATEERFILITDRPSSTRFNKVSTPSYIMPCRRFISEDNCYWYFDHPCLRSILKFTFYGVNYAKHLRSFVLLRVLHQQMCRLDEFPYGMELLVHLRYLATQHSLEYFPSSICNLWNLQTLIIYAQNDNGIVLPSNISDLVNLRHLRSYNPFNKKSNKKTFFLPSIEKPMNLQTFSDVLLGANFHKYFPYIKEFTCSSYFDEENDFKSLTYLEKLNVTGLFRSVESTPDYITFPSTLKSLTLAECRLAWSDMRIIQSLPNLQVLKLKLNAVLGCCWNTDGQEFLHLEFLKLEWLNIRQWEAYSPSFPCLKHLEIIHCYNLEEIPLTIGDIPTLELIKIKKCRRSVGESVRSIQEEQHDSGNYYLKIDVLDDKGSSRSRVEEWLRETVTETEELERMET